MILHADTLVWLCIFHAVQSRLNFAVHIAEQWLDAQENSHQGHLQALQKHEKIKLFTCWKVCLAVPTPMHK